MGYRIADAFVTCVGVFCNRRNILALESVFELVMVAVSFGDDRVMIV